MVNPATKIDHKENSNLANSVSQIGKAGIKPFLELIENYREDLGEILKATETALSSGSMQLDDSSNPSEQIVSDQFRQAAEWISTLRKELVTTPEGEIMQKIEDRGREHPELLLAISTVLGLVLGRVGKYSVNLAEDIPDKPLQSVNGAQRNTSTKETYNG